MFLCFIFEKVYKLVFERKKFYYYVNDINFY